MSGYGARTLKVATAFAALGLLSACDSNEYVPPPPPKVTVAAPTQQAITRYFETTGTTAAVNSANLVARVQGFLQEVKYNDGAFVKKGTSLFIIEPEPYKLKAEQTKAAQDGAQASLKQLEADYQRQVDLANRQVASKQALDQALASRDGAIAKLKQSEVDTQQADINLGYTDVKAPFDGVVTARQVSVGELVGGSTPTQLATIVQLDPIYVNFNISEKDAIEAREHLRRRGEKPSDLTGKLAIEVGLQTEKGYPHKGVLDYVAPSVSQSTGTQAVRGIFPNTDRSLLPGNFVRVRIPLTSQPTPVLLVPDAALGSDQGGRYVLVVGADNIVEQRNVTTGPVIGDLRVIESGLKPDDRVVVGGQLRAIPGLKVDPQPQPVAASAK